MKENSLFHKLINCKLCGKKYRLKKFREVSKYVCSGYCNYGKDFCTKNSIEEEFLLFVIKKYCFIKNIPFKKTHAFISNLIDCIDVDDQIIIIKYKNGSKSIITSSLIKIT